MGLLRVRFSCGSAFLREEEHQFFDVIHEALRNIYHVFPKVRLEDLIVS